MISLRQIIWRSAGPIFTNFTSNESFLAVDYWSGPLFSISQGTLPWQPILCKNGAKLPTPLHLSLCHSKMQWAIVLRMSALKAPLIALHRVKMVVFELNRVENGNCAATRPKLAYIAEYLNNYWASLYLCFSIDRCVYADYKTAISFAVVQGTLLW